MTTRRFFTLALLLPLAIGIVGLITPWLKMFGASLIFGGVPYVPVAVIAVLLIRRSPNLRRLVRISLLIPVAFTVLAVTLFWIAGSSEATSSRPLQDTITQLMPMAVYSILFSYFYVGLSWGLWAIARRLNVVQNEFAT